MGTMAISNTVDLYSGYAVVGLVAVGVTLVLWLLASHFYDRWDRRTGIAADVKVGRPWRTGGIGRKVRELRAARRKRIAPRQRWSAKVEQKAKAGQHRAGADRTPGGAA